MSNGEYLNIIINIEIISFQQLKWICDYCGMSQSRDCEISRNQKIEIENRHQN